MTAADRAEELMAILRTMRRVVVAFSGGVDSSVVAKAAYLALGDDAVAVTADSPSVARRELADAIRIAKQIGIQHRVVATKEFANPDYLRNDGERCYFCKSELYDVLEILRCANPESIVVSGANLDDAGDYRPGLTAAAEHHVRHPMQEAGLTKADVRELASHWNLDVWDKPASPCLSSRIAPGVAVTPDRTRRIEAAEELLRGLGLRDCRVRLHDGELARIEVPIGDLYRIADETVRKMLAAEFRRLGFRFVTLDLEGLRSGSMNELVNLETRRKYLPLEAES